jgi:hypothetical protein
VVQQKKVSRCKQKYRGATKDSIAVKSEILWRNKRWHRVAIINIVVQQKMGIVVKSEIS